MNELKRKLQQEKNFMEINKSAFIKMQEAVKKDDLTAFVDLIIELANSFAVPVPDEVAEFFNNKDSEKARLFLLDLMTVEN